MTKLYLRNNKPTSLITLNLTHYMIKNLGTLQHRQTYFRNPRGGHYALFTNKTT